MPTDPKELMSLVSQSNGLVSSGLQPWHLKASYKLLDAQGKSTDEGTIEEFWASHHRRRITYTGKNFIRTVYWTDAGILESGSATLPSYLIEQTRADLVEPIPPTDFLQTQVFSLKDESFGTVHLTCATAKVAPPPKADNFGKTLGPSYCVNTDKPVLRVSITGEGLRQVVRNGVVLFQGRYIPRELKLVQQNTPLAALHVDSLEALSMPLDDAVFTPSADAKLITPPISILSGAANGMLISQAYPHYPVIAKQSHTSGTVVIAALIGKDGKPSKLQPESGPTMLREAAMNAAQGWAYWPFFDDGEPVEVMTKINLIFNLGN